MMRRLHIRFSTNDKRILLYGRINKGQIKSLKYPQKNRLAILFGIDFKKRLLDRYKIKMTRTTTRSFLLLRMIFLHKPFMYLKKTTNYNCNNNGTDQRPKFHCVTSLKKHCNNNIRNASKNNKTEKWFQFSILLCRWNIRCYYPANSLYISSR